MTGPENYKEAGRLIGVAQDARGDGDDRSARYYIAEAQVHATLALAAATALAHDRMMPDRDGEQWRQAAATPMPDRAPAGGGQL